VSRLEIHELTRRSLLRDAVTDAAGLALCAALALFSAGCSKGNEYKPPPPPPVTVSKPVSQPVADYLLTTGNVAASQTVDLVARVQGYLRSINFTDGTIVEAGQLLFVIEPDQYLARQQANQAQLQSAQSEYDRQQRMMKDNATSQGAVEKWAAQREAAQSALTLSKIDVAYTRVTAPFTGRIGRHLVDVGNLVGSSSTPTKLATLEQIDPAYVYFTVNERDVLRIRAAAISKGTVVGGQIPAVPVSVGLQTEKGYPHEGKLDFAGTGLDTSSGALELRASMPNPDRLLLPGIFARLRIALGEPVSRLLVPDRIVGNDQGGSYVYVVGKDNKVVQQRIEAGPVEEGGMRVVISGLDPNSAVIVDGLQTAVPGNQVTPTEKALASSPATASKTP
jgi:RND family efflux transporter MFP subunit